MKLLQKKERLLSLLLALSAVAALKADDEFDNPGWNFGKAISNINLDDYKIGKSSTSFAGTNEAADESRLIEALGENPYNYMKVLGISNAAGRWSKTLTNIQTANKFLPWNWSWKPEDLFGKTSSQVAAAKADCAKGAIAYYQDKFKDEAFDVLSKDLQAFEQSVAQNRDQSMYDRLKFLLDSGKQAKSELMKQQFEVEYNKFRPSVTGESLADAITTVESLIRFAEDEDMAKLHAEVLKKLQNSKQQVGILKNKHKDSIQDAVVAANGIINKLSLSPDFKKNTSTIDVYQDVVAELERIDNKESEVQSNIIEVNNKVDALIANYGDSPSHALDDAKTKLKTLKNELQSFEQRRVGGGMIKDKKAEIKIQEDVIKVLQDKVKIAEDEDRAVQVRIKNLLNEHEDDVEKALKAIQDKLKLSRVKNSTDQKIEKHLKQLQADEKKLQGQLDAQVARAKDYLRTEGFDVAKSNPIAFAKKIQEKLETVQIELAALRDVRSPNKRDIKEKEDEIAKLKLSIEHLKKEQKTFEPKVAKRLKELLSNNDDNPKKALQMILPKVSKSYLETASNWIGFGKQTPMDKQVEKISDPIDNEVGVRLVEQIKELNANDSVEIALARLHTASPVDIPAAAEKVLAARLAEKGLSIDSLDYSARQALSERGQNASQQINKIMNSRMSDSQKQAEKREIMQELIKQIGLIFAAAKGGVSVRAIEDLASSGDVTSLALNKAFTSVVGLPVDYSSSSSLDSSNNSRSFNSYQSYDESRAVVPYSPSRNMSNSQYSNSRAMNSQGSRNASYAQSTDISRLYDDEFDEQRNNALQFLGLDASASQTDIRKRYLDLARQYHPDKGGNAAVFQQIHDAYELVKA